MVELLFSKFDVNNDRSISLKEFRAKVFGTHVMAAQDQNTLVVQHFIEDLDELIGAAKSSFENVFKPLEHQGTLKVEEFRNALKVLGMNVEEEKVKVC